MKENYVTIRNLKLFYVDNGQKGIPLLMIHGNSMNSHLFYKQFGSSLLNRFRIISLDLPGHGQSARDKKPGTMYGVGSYIEILKDFIRYLELGELIIFGHSLGGHIAIHLADEIESVDIKGLMVMGTPPLTIPPELSKAFLPNPAMALTFKPGLNDTETDSLTASFININSPDFYRVRESISSCDPMVRPMIGQSIATDLKTDEAEIIRKATFPVAILHGVNENNVNGEYISELRLPLWKNEIIKIKDAGHMAFLENPERFNELILEFIS